MLCSLFFHLSFRALQQAPLVLPEDVGAEEGAAAVLAQEKLDDVALAWHKILFWKKIEPGCCTRSSPGGSGSNIPPGTPGYQHRTRNWLPQKNNMNFLVKRFFYFIFFYVYPPMQSPASASSAHSQVVALPAGTNWTTWNLKSQQFSQKKLQKIKKYLSFRAIQCAPVLLPVSKGVRAKVGAPAVLAQEKLRKAQQFPKCFSFKNYFFCDYLIVALAFPYFVRPRDSAGALAAILGMGEAEQRGQCSPLLQQWFRTKKSSHKCTFFFCFPWGSPEPQSFGPNFAFFREALAILWL